MTDLTEAQQRGLGWIVHYCLKHNAPPSQVQVQRAMGYKTRQAAYSVVIEPLVRKGYLCKNAIRHRVIRVLGLEYAVGGGDEAKRLRDLTGV